MKRSTGMLCIVFLLGTFGAGRAQDSLSAPKDKIRYPFIHKITGLFKEKSYVIAPELGRKPETGILGGIFYLQVFKLAPKADSTTRKSNTETYLDYTEKKQVLAQIKNNLIFKNDRFYLKGENFYNKFPDLFWGIGPRTTPEMQQNISYELFSLNQRLLTRINSRYFAGLIYQYVKLTDVRFDAGGTLDTGHVSGAHGSRSSGLGFDLLYDSRDNILNTYKGLFVELSSVFNDKAFGGDHFFNSYALDIRQFTNLGKQRILALQGLINYNLGDVPFRQLAMIGGDMMMRGYYYGRYRDKLMIAAQAEFRFPVYKIVGLTVFASGAEVGPSFGAMNWNDLHYTVGLCLRVMINKTERLNMGIDSGIGQNTSGLYFNSGEAF